ncbi:serine hydrolase domain-containing protein [Streptomyces sulphureus]|uniref:serine hydrolase domain-containing protein n=1 Tax=Streptomyces sulphureus TaxID=47758 RepID=UPI0009966AEE|nr:serine hydrolase [Streptomyces sulphureus]
MKPFLTSFGKITVFFLAGVLALCLSAIEAGSQGAQKHKTHTAAPGCHRPHRGYAPSGSVLHRTTPQEAGMTSGPLNAFAHDMKKWTDPSSRNEFLFPGATWLIASEGNVVARSSAGYAVRYGKDGRNIPARQRQQARPDTIYDLASLSKLFTSLVAVQQLESGRLHLNTPVSRYLPGFSVNNKERITVKELLTHTSGLPPDPQPSLSQVQGGKQEQTEAILRSRPLSPAGSRYLYSDLNMLSLQLVLEKITGRTLDALVRRDITAPLGMRDTGYNPPARERKRIAATSYEAGRGLIHGSVHDNNAWAFGGVAGHAGVFSTVDDLAVLSQTILNGGSYCGQRILSPHGINLLQRNYNQEFPGNAHGLGFELDQKWYMGPLSSVRTLGHTGFTGTSLVIDRTSRSIVILLTNRVHPADQTPSTNPARRKIAQTLARAVSVLPSGRAPRDLPYHTGGCLGWARPPVFLPGMWSCGPGDVQLNPSSRRTSPRS